MFANWVDITGIAIVLFVGIMWLIKEVDDETPGNSKSRGNK